MKALLLLIAASLSAAGLSAEGSPSQTPLVVDEDAVEDYWVPARELMPATMPPELRSTHATLEKYGTIWLDFELTIDATGTPRDIKFVAIEPSEVKPGPFLGRQMFMRYRPAPGNAARVPIRFRAHRKHWIPPVSPADDVIN